MRKLILSVRFYKPKYKFNPESLSYDRIKASFRRIITNILTIVFALFILTFISNLLLSRFYDTPKEKGLKRENEYLKFNIEMINKQLTLMEKALTDIQKRDSNLYRVIFEAEPLPSSIRNAGYGGINKYRNMEGYESSDLIIETSKRVDKLARMVYIQSKSYDELIELARNKEQMYASIPAIQPISNKDLKHTASGWGYRIHPIYKIRKFHYGMDFTASTGTEVHATGDGTVKTASSSLSGYGNCIIIDHGFGYETLYAHLSAYKVREGQKVKRGQVIGFVGNSGLSTAPHLHYEVHVNGQPVNPINYYFNDLTPSEFAKISEISSHYGQTFD